MHSSSLHNPCLSKIEKGFMSPTIVSATHWFSERALWWLGVNFIFPAVSWSVNHFLADDVTANLQVFLPLLLCRRNHKYSFCHGNAVRCRGLFGAGDSVQAPLFLPAQINSWVWKVRHKLPVQSLWLMENEGSFPVWILDTAKICFLWGLWQNLNSEKMCLCCFSFLKQKLTYTLWRSSPTKRPFSSVKKKKVLFTA